MKIIRGLGVRWWVNESSEAREDSRSLKWMTRGERRSSRLFNAKSRRQTRLIREYTHGPHGTDPHSFSIDPTGRRIYRALELAGVDQRNVVVYRGDDD